MTSTVQEIEYSKVKTSIYDDKYRSEKQVQFFSPIVIVKLKFLKQLNGGNLGKQLKIGEIIKNSLLIVLQF